MKKYILISTIIIAVVFFSQCEPKIIVAERVGCPSCDDTVNWEGYGEWKFLDTRTDGFSDKDEEDYHSDNYLMSCGWTYESWPKHQTSMEYYSCDTGVVLIWNWGSFHAVELRDHWAGLTKEGIRMDADMQAFFSVYPDFKPINADSSYSNSYYPYIKYLFRWETSKNYFSAGFSASRKLNYLYIYKKYGLEVRIRP